MEDNLVEVARKIFSAEPAEPGTIEFGLEDCAPPTAGDEEKTRILFEVLMILFLEGMKVRYGVEPERLTPAQIENLSRYVLSYGFSTHIRSDDLTAPPPVQRPTSLKDHHERFYDLERAKWHEISFDWAVIIRPGGRSQSFQQQ